MRIDLQTVQKWVKPKSRLLDLGCGDGTLLLNLKNEKQVDGLGFEINDEHILACVAKGLSVVEHNLNDGFAHIKDKSFDVVVMSMALQAMSRPDMVLDEMLRVGNECIITFPNFGHWHCRTHLTLKGEMPVSKNMPYEWYNTPNTHFCTVNDFERLCREKNIRVINKKMVTHEKKFSYIPEFLSNLLAVTAIYHVSY